ncbi:copper resistance protein CopZ [Paenibacillus xylanexedens]|uniref:cation transporter n=1 Tax=Paenibacillus xylanexedens TaxID=528191 RepID=UPI00093877DC|nr:cation transporter [Paenibacillus xylanexedens]APO46081.1 copper resistance protein CopZ [Paenibacillus xylanexedens]
MKNIVLNLQGMSCQHCVNSIEGALKEIGVSGTVNLSDDSVEATYDKNQVSLEQIKEVIEEQGYEVA